MLKKQDRFEWSFRSHEVLPHGAQAVLMVLLRLIARSPEPGVWRPAPDLRRHGRGLLLARLMEFIDADAAVEADLQKLLAAGVVTWAEGGGLAVAVDVAELVRNAPAPRGPAANPVAAGFKDRGGRPRGIEDVRQRRMRLVTQFQGGKAAAEAAGGSAAETPRKNLPENLREKPPGNLSETKGFSGGFRGRNPEVSVLEVSAGFQELAAAAAKEKPDSSAAAAASSAGPARGHGETETSKPVSGEVSGEVSAGVSSEVSITAVELGQEFVVQFDLRPPHDVEAAPIIQGYLDRGDGPVLIRSVMALKRGKSAVSARMLDKALVQHRPRSPALGASAAPAAPRVAAAPTLHPDFDLYPEWKALPGEQRMAIDSLLAVLGAKNPLNGRGTVKFVFDRYRDEFVRVARKRPELWDIIGEEAEYLRLRSG